MDKDCLIIIMEINMMDNFQIIKKKDMVFQPMLMEKGMKDSGIITLGKEKASFYMKMVIFMKDYGKMINQIVQEN